MSKGLKVKLGGLVQKINLYHLIQENLLEKQLNQILSGLCSDPKNLIVIISGRSKNFLEDKFRNLPLTLVGEHGAWHCSGVYLRKPRVAGSSAFAFGASAWGAGVAGCN